MTDPTTRPCGAGHARYPETVCTEPAGHTGAHAGRFTVDGRVGGAAAWGGADAATDPTGAAVCPLEAPAGADAGMESPEGVAGAQADTARPARMTADTATDDGLDALYARLEDWKAATAAGMRVIDELRAERDSLAADTPLNCSDERHKTQAFALAVALEKAVAERDRARRIAVELEQQLARATEQITAN